jgi:small GTP-binding protein
MDAEAKWAWGKTLEEGCTRVQCACHFGRIRKFQSFRNIWICNERNVKGKKPPAKKMSILLIGSEQVGKTSLIHRFLEQHEEYIPPTILNQGYRVDNVMIWDTSGKRHLRHLRQDLILHATVIFLCFDLHSEQSFLELETRWLPELQHANGRIFLIGCKKDLIGQISRKDIQLFLTKNNFVYYENAMLAFTKAISLCCKQDPIPKPTKKGSPWFLRCCCLST